MWAVASTPRGGSFAQPRWPAGDRVPPCAQAVASFSAGDGDPIPRVSGANAALLTVLRPGRGPHPGTPGRRCAAGLGCPPWLRIVDSLKKRR